MSALAELLRAGISAELDAKSNIKYLYAKFHDGTGTDIAISGPASPLAFTFGTATTTHQWDSVGSWTGSDGTTASNRLFRDENNTPELEAIARMDDIPSGSYMLVASFFSNNKTGSGNELGGAFGSPTNGNYCQLFKIETGGDVAFFIQDADSNGATCRVAAANYSLSTWFTVGFHIDILNKTIDGYIDNTVTPVQSVSMATLTGTLPAPLAAPTVLGMTLLGGGSLSNIFGGSTAGRILRIRDMLLIKDTGAGLRTYATQIIADMYNNPGDLSNAMRNL